MNKKKIKKSKKEKICSRDDVLKLNDELNKIESLKINAVHFFFRKKNPNRIAL